MPMKKIREKLYFMRFLQKASLRCNAGTNMHADEAKLYAKHIHIIKHELS
jgi:hypothetical protein